MVALEEPELVKLRRVVTGDGFERVAAIARIEVEEHPAHPIEQTTTALQGLNRIGKGRGRGRAGDRGDLGTVLGHRLVEGWRKMFRANAVERRQAKRRSPGFKKRVVGHSRASARTDGRNLTMPRARGRDGRAARFLGLPVVRLHACRTLLSRRRCAWR